MRLTLHTTGKSLLVRADFVLGGTRAGERRTYRRWRRVLAEALPRLLGCPDRCPRAVVRLHRGDGEARYSAWLRLWITRRPSRRRLRRLKARLRGNLEAALLPVDGRVVKVGVRRCRPRVAVVPPPAPAPVAAADPVLCA